MLGVDSGIGSSDFRVGAVLANSCNVSGFTIVRFDSWCVPWVNGWLVYACGPWLCTKSSRGHAGFDAPPAPAARPDTPLCSTCLSEQRLGHAQATQVRGGLCGECRQALQSLGRGPIPGRAWARAAQAERTRAGRPAACSGTRPIP